MQAAAERGWEAARVGRPKPALDDDEDDDD
jgi:hypothetical protein